jgi:hypothetical protein
MGIDLRKGTTERDWLAVAEAVGEAAVQGALLGVDGYSGAISSLAKVLEALRGEDSIEKRAATLVFETLGFAIASTLASVRLRRTLQRPLAEEITRQVISRAQRYLSSRQVTLTSRHLLRPTELNVFDDALSQFLHEIKVLDPECGEPEISAQFRMALSDGLNKIRARRPEYFSPVTNLLSGPDNNASNIIRDWEKYRAELISRFEDYEMFAENDSQVTLAQCYQPLRTWWTENSPDDLFDEFEVEKRREPTIYHLRRLEDEVVEWLDSSTRHDRVRLISGGPGSGKSTFVRRLAARLATELRWRILVVPLQRLRGSGPLEARINGYFRSDLNEPFDDETVPLASLGRDGHPDWVIIFDGLDELAKEGSGSESVAQEFATALGDWRVRVGEHAAVRVIVTGRAPSMQDARRRLGLLGKGTLHVADMLPFKLPSTRGPHDDEDVIDDPLGLATVDQRPEFWKRWAIAKGVAVEVPEAMTSFELQDLTKEPLLAHLLIMSGYTGANWRDAADNRNRIYDAILRRIWERERSKETRRRLNDLGYEGFLALMQALGLAAWGGGGRTGNEEEFNKMSRAFMRPGLQDKAKDCGVGELDNVAILFYTRKDEAGGRGYEFLHKSFGEYLTATALISTYLRWSKQVSDPDVDMRYEEFANRWLRLTRWAPVSNEMKVFIRNEARLIAQRENSQASWLPARHWCSLTAPLISDVLRVGLPAHEATSNWRSAETAHGHSELALFAMLDAVARVGYPTHLKHLPVQDGGWESGPLKIQGLSDTITPSGLPNLLKRQTALENGFQVNQQHGKSTIVETYPLRDLLSRINFDGCMFPILRLVGADLEGCSFRRAFLLEVDLAFANLSHASFDNCYVSLKNLDDAILEGTSFENVMNTPFTRSTGVEASDDN